MQKTWKIVIIVGLMLAISAVVYLKQSNKSGSTAEPQAGGSKEQSTPNIPRLVDLGAGKCIPCKMMAPILDSLKKEYDGKFQVDVFDVWKDPQIGTKYGVRVIPTQIFYDASGKELFRHEGFMSKEDILAKWKQLGILFDKNPKDP